MNPDDYAIIIGLDNYPGLEDLGGPVNDARAFRDWIVSPTGGGVPNDSDHVQVILSSNYSLPFPSIRDAHPVVSEIENAFWKLHDIQVKTINERGQTKIGRRLYIYMAGHGIAPNASGGINQSEAALLMANVNPLSFGPTYQIPGAYTATWFSQNDCFDEIFLFMDCCRGAEWVPSINAFLPPQGTANNAKRCYAFSTKWSQNAREKTIVDEDGQERVRGIFTKVLLWGLEGGAAQADPSNPGQGVITVSSLKSYLYGNMGKMQPQVDPSAAIEIQEPDIDYWPRRNDGKDIVIKTVSLPSFPVLIRLPAGQSGQVRIFTHLNGQMKRIAGKGALATDWSVDLPRGLYLAMFTDTNANDTEVMFEVTGSRNENATQNGATVVTF